VAPNYIVLMQKIKLLSYNFHMVPTLKERVKKRLKIYTKPLNSNVAKDLNDVTM